MQTYSHILMTATINQLLVKKAVSVHHRAFLTGSVLPDVPLLILTISAALYYRVVAPLPPGYRFFEWFDVLYFTNPLWKAGHNLFHAPFILLLLGLIGYVAARRGQAWGWSVVWLAAGCGLHAGVDIVTHYNDGPLVLFPFNWNYRFLSPISYWDRNHYANLFAPLEHGLDVFLVGYLAFRCRHERDARRKLT